MILRFWGTRGSIATPGPTTTQFGGNTSCVEVETKSGAHFIFDCGTGARLLGTRLVSEGPKPFTSTILLSHTHWDHIQGFPFFAPAFVPGNKILVCGPMGCHRSLPDVLSGQMEYTYFPVELGQLGAEFEYRDLTEGTHDINGVRVTAQFLNHPAITLGYRLEVDGVCVVYLCDHEPYWEKLWRSNADPGLLTSILHGGDHRHAMFMQNADVVIHDAQYTPEEYAAKRNWGHSTYSYATQIAAAANVKRLFLTHHDPSHDDDMLFRLQDKARELARSLGSDMEVSYAFEGCQETFENAEVHRAHVGAIEHFEAVCACSLRVALVDDDATLRGAAKDALVKAGHRVFESSEGAEAMQMIQKRKPDLVILDLIMPAPTGLDVLEHIRSNPATASTPVLVLTSQGDEESTHRSFELGATDFLTKPFTPPQLDARVRSCFARAAQHGHKNPFVLDDQGVSVDAG